MSAIRRRGVASHRLLSKHTAIEDNRELVVLADAGRGAPPELRWIAWSGHADELAGDEAGLVGGEEGDDLGDLVGLADVAEGAGGGDGGGDLGGHPAGVGGGRVDHVGGDAVAAELGGR